MNYLLFACSASFTEHKELGLWTLLFYHFHCAPSQKSFKSQLAPCIRNYLRKSPFYWLNLHLQTLKIIILRKQHMVQCRFSLPFITIFSHQFHFTCCLWLVMQYFPSLIQQNPTTSWIVLEVLTDVPFLIDSFTKKKSQHSY